MTDLHLSDERSYIRVSIVENGEAVPCTSGSAVLKLLKKNKAVTERVMSYYTDGSDGIFQYRLIAGDIDGAKGKWTGQVHLDIPSFYGHTSKFDINIDDNVDT